MKNKLSIVINSIVVFLKSITPPNITYTLKETIRICNSFKSTIIWIAILPIMSTYTSIFLITSIIFDIYYLFLILIKYIKHNKKSKKETIIKFEKYIPKTKSNTLKTLYNLFLDKPKRFSFTLVYKILNYVHSLNNREKFNENELNQIYKETIYMWYTIFFRLFIILVFGIPIMTVKNNNLMALKIIATSKFKFKNNKAKLLFVISNFSILFLMEINITIDNLKIKLIKNDIIFNPGRLKIFSLIQQIVERNTKQTELAQHELNNFTRDLIFSKHKIPGKIYKDINKNDETIEPKEHLTTSLQIKDKIIHTNLTSGKQIVYIDSITEKSEEIKNIETVLHINKKNNNNTDDFFRQYITGPYTTEYDPKITHLTGYNNIKGKHLKTLLTMAAHLVTLEGEQIGHLKEYEDTKNYYYVKKPDSLKAIDIKNEIIKTYELKEIQKLSDEIIKNTDTNKNNKMEMLLLRITDKDKFDKHTDIIKKNSELFDKFK